MANIQKQFEEFNDCIRLKRFEENEILRDKRDIIRRKIDDNLPSIFEGCGEEMPAYEFRDQGSYKIGTGIVPIDGDYDIDQGLYFQVSAADYPDPVVLKERVLAALEGHTQSVKIRRPCVTVQYQIEKEPVYHVDIAVYSDGTQNTDEKSRLAVGKQNSGEEFRYWEISDAQGLSALLSDHFKRNDGRQFRRVVRYLKRWKDVNFPASGSAAPLGIALTVAAYYDLQPSYFDAMIGRADDLTALRSVVNGMKNRFLTIWSASSQAFVKRLVLVLPVDPQNDLFASMTDHQMATFEGKLSELQEALDGAASEVAPEEACKLMAGVFGSDFRIPDKQETAKRTAAPAIVSSHNSA